MRVNFGNCSRRLPCLWSLIDDDVEPVILHRRIEIFFDRRLQPVNLVDEEDVAFFQAGQQSREFARFLDHWPTGVLHTHAHRVGDDMGERRLAEPWRSTQQDVLEDIAPLLRGFHEHSEPFTHFHLPGELAEHRRPERDLERGIGLERLDRGGAHPSFFVSTSSVPRLFTT